MNKYNYKMLIRYIGTNYNGWQRQKNGIGIQEIFENLLSRLFNEKIIVIGASRTDAKVHALKQVANFKTTNYKNPEIIYNYLNAKLPRDIAVLGVEEVDIKFNARFSAKGKTYIYKINTKPDPFLYNLSWYFDKKLDILKMIEVLEIVKNYKDLTSLAKDGIYLRKEIDLRETKLYFDGKIITIEITASHFLRNMVRRIVGHCVAVGRGSLSLLQLKDIIEKKNPKYGKFTAPPEGLYLKEVYY